MRRIVVLIVAVLLWGAFAADADARWGDRRRARQGYTTYQAVGANGYPTNVDTEKRFYNATMSLQDIAYMRAQWMAHQDNLDHGIHSYTTAPPWPVEVGEGIGSSTERLCATCVVGSTVVADAQCRSKRTGIWYRVRFWK